MLDVKRFGLMIFAYFFMFSPSAQAQEVPSTISNSNMDLYVLHQGLKYEPSGNVLFTGGNDRIYVLSPEFLASPFDCGQASQCGPVLPIPQLPPGLALDIPMTSLQEPPLRLVTVADQRQYDCGEPDLPRNAGRTVLDTNQCGPVLPIESE